MFTFQCEHWSDYGPPGWLGRPSPGKVCHEEFESKQNYSIVVEIVSALYEFLS